MLQGLIFNRESQNVRSGIFESDTVRGLRMPALIDLDDKAGFSGKASDYRNAKNFYMVTNL